MLGMASSRWCAMVRFLFAWSFLVHLGLQDPRYLVEDTRERHHATALRRSGENQLSCNMSAGNGFLYERSMQSPHSFHFTVRNCRLTRIYLTHILERYKL